MSGVTTVEILVIGEMLVLISMDVMFSANMDLQDCQDLLRTRLPGEYSAFGNDNVVTGPFYDPSQNPKSSSLRSRIRDWERADQMFKDAPGRQGRMKSKAALEQKSRQAEDDPDDWFGNNNLSKSTRTAPRHPPREPKKMISFGKSYKDDRQYAPLPNRPSSLLSRLGGGDDLRRPHDTNRRDENRRSRKSRSENNNRPRREERSGSSAFADTYRQAIPTGPRYRGGYDNRHGT
jgi:protein AIR1/2